MEFIESTRRCLIAVFIRVAAQVGRTDLAAFSRRVSLWIILDRKERERERERGSRRGKQRADRDSSFQGFDLSRRSLVNRAFQSRFQEKLWARANGPASWSRGRIARGRTPRSSGRWCWTRKRVSIQPGRVMLEPGVQLWRLTRRMRPPDGGHRLPASTPFGGSRFRDCSPFCFLSAGSLTKPGCSPERELGVRQQRRRGVWWIWLGCVCSSSAEKLGVWAESVDDAVHACGSAFLRGFKCFPPLRLRS